MENYNGLIQVTSDTDQHYNEDEHGPEDGCEDEDEHGPEDGCEDEDEHEHEHGPENGCEDEVGSCHVKAVDVQDTQNNNMTSVDIQPENSDGDKGGIKNKQNGTGFNEWNIPRDDARKKEIICQGNWKVYVYTLP